MDLKHISDAQLLKGARELASKEREILTQVLHHLREIERRRLFSSLGFSSLFDYAIKHLGYSSDQAFRRISAMRLLKGLPELESKIEDGSLNLTNLSLAHQLFRKEEVSKSDQMEILRQLENKSTREAEKIVLARSADPAQLKPDRIRTVGSRKIEIKFVADEGLAQKLEKVKGLLAHTNSTGSMAALVEKICDIAIARLSPTERNIKSKRSIPGHSASGTENRIDKAAVRQDSLRARKVGPAGRRPIPAAVRRQVWQNAKGRCQNCDSQFALQVDHIQPIALGGNQEIENFRLLCRSCNQRAAIVRLGQQKMDEYLKRP